MERARVLWRVWLGSRKTPGRDRLMSGKKLLFFNKLLIEKGVRAVFGEQRAGQRYQAGIPFARELNNRLLEVTSDFDPLVISRPCAGFKQWLAGRASAVRM